MDKNDVMQELIRLAAVANGAQDKSAYDAYMNAFNLVKEIKIK